MKLTGREKSSLILEGVITVILLILLDMAIITIAQDVIQSNPGITSGIFMIKQSMRIGPMQAQIWSYQRILIAILVVIDIWVVWWRLRRRYHLYHYPGIALYRSGTPGSPNPVSTKRERTTRDYQC